MQSIKYDFRFIFYICKYKYVYKTAESNNEIKDLMLTEVWNREDKDIKIEVNWGIN